MGGDPNPTPDKVLELWNKNAHPNYPRLKNLTPTRKAHVKARLAEYPDKAFWIAFIERVNKSKFLRGDGPSNGSTP